MLQTFAISSLISFGVASSMFHTPYRSFQSRTDKPGRCKIFPGWRRNAHIGVPRKVDCSAEARIRPAVIIRMQLTGWRARLLDHIFILDARIEDIRLKDIDEFFCLVVIEVIHGYRTICHITEHAMIALQIDLFLQFFQTFMLSIR